MPCQEWYVRVLLEANGKSFNNFPWESKNAFGAKKETINSFLQRAIPASFCSLKQFHNRVKTLDLPGIQTKIARVEGKHADSWPPPRRANKNESSDQNNFPLDGE